MSLAIDRPDERVQLPVTPIDLHVAHGRYTVTAIGYEPAVLGTFATAADAWAALDELDAPDLR